jgi:NDP-sugar pyrophosphorylase family protein
VLPDVRTKTEYYFDLERFAHRDLFTDCDRVWDALPRLIDYIKENLRPAIQGTVSPGAWVSDQVFLAPGAVVEPGAMIIGPAIIGSHSVIRHGAYIREYCLIGEHCVVGHASEIKHAIMLDGSHAAHFNYVGDSILGNKVNLGAGTKLSNVKNDRGQVQVSVAGNRYPTGLTKFGAIVGDGAQLGCNSVTSPGSLIGPGALIYANTVVRGAVPARCIVKLRQTIDVTPYD